jgi:hypothetical protein
MASSPNHHHIDEATTLSPPVKPTESLTDDLLAEIFLRIPCPAALVRASAACASFRRLITDGAFLHRSRHRPLLLIFLDLDVSKGFHPVEALHPNAPAARAMARNVSLDFLPRPDPNWYVSDIRDGRVLLGRCLKLDDGVVSMDHVVCDPSSLSQSQLLVYFISLSRRECHD